MTTDVKNGNLIITIPLDGDEGVSKSGKNQLVASTRGTVRLAAGGQDLSLNLNLYKPVK